MNSLSIVNKEEVNLTQKNEHRILNYFHLTTELSCDICQLNHQYLWGGEGEGVGILHFPRELRFARRTQIDPDHR